MMSLPEKRPTRLSRKIKNADPNGKCHVVPCLGSWCLCRKGRPQLILYPITACDLIKRMLEFDPKKRISARGAFAHYYFDSLRDPNDELEVIRQFTFANDNSDSHEDSTNEPEEEAEFDHSRHSADLPVDVDTWRTTM